MNEQKSKLAHWVRAAGAAVLAFSAAAIVHAQNAIESVTSSMQSGAEVVRRAKAATQEECPAVSR